MVTRAISCIERTSFLNALTQPSFSSHSSSAFKHGQSSALGSLTSCLSSTPPSVGSTLTKQMLSFSTATTKSLLMQRNFSCTPAFRSVITNPQHGCSSVSPQISQSSHYSSSAGYANINPRFGKQRRNRGDIKGASGNDVCFGSYGLQVLEPAWITSKQLLAGQLAMKRNMRGGKLVLRIFPHKPVSLRPAETRMGRGKGNVAYWVAGVRAGRVLYEINGVSETVARKAISVAASKFPVRTQFVRS